MVKNNKGITLTSLIIYIIGMTIAVALISTLMSFFTKNIKLGDINNDTTQYTKFSSVFSDEINNKNNIIVDCQTSGSGNGKVSYIVFSSGNQYTFMGKNNAIYKNNIKICKDVEDCDFTYKFIDSKYAITVNFKTNNIDLTGTDAITYNL